MQRRRAIAAVLGLAGCAAPPGSDLHMQVGRQPDQAAVAVVVWLPERELTAAWLQFEKRDGEGKPTGVPLSVLLQPPSGPAPQLPARPGWQPRLAALPLAPGRYVVSRWVGELAGGKSVVSARIDWTFETQAAAGVHLGQFELALGAPRDGAIEYRLRALPATPADVAMLRGWLPAASRLPWRPVPWPEARSAGDTARVGGTSVRSINVESTIWMK
jgi:hypothetical protein